MRLQSPLKLRLESVPSPFRGTIRGDGPAPKRFHRQLGRRALQVPVADVQKSFLSFPGIFRMICSRLRPLALAPRWLPRETDILTIIRHRIIDSQPLFAGLSFYDIIVSR